MNAMCRNRSSALLVFCLTVVCSHVSYSQDRNAEVPAPQSKAESRLEDMVLVDTGTLPVLISAPHGGLLKIPGVEPREGKGIVAGPSGFFTGRDGGTEELAKAVVKAIEKRIGQRPYFVISSVDRKYLDPNRPAEIAYEDEDAKTVYDRYHNTCRDYCREILKQHSAGLLLDIHGQGTSKTTVYRGTGNGKTVARLRERFGDSAHSGEASFFSMLHRRGWTVFPVPFDKPEQSGFTGGYIVQSHGSHRPDGIDAMQLEFGGDYRSKANRAKTAETLADAVAEYLQQYIPKSIPTSGNTTADGPNEKAKE